MDRYELELLDSLIASATLHGTAQDADTLTRLRAKLLAASPADSAREPTLKETKRCCTICDAKKTCHVCGDQTLVACSDCRINFAATVYVCRKRECRDEHERRCRAAREPTPPLEADDLHTGDNDIVDLWSGIVGAIDTALDSAKELEPIGGEEATIIEQLEGALADAKKLDLWIVKHAVHEANQLAAARSSASSGERP